MTNSEHIPPRPDPLAPPTRIHLPRSPRLAVDLDAINARYRATLDTTSSTQMRVALLASVTDIAPLVAEVDRLYSMLRRCRLRNANLTAAARATLTAARDGDRHPWAYLRDELRHPDPEPGDASSDRGRR